MDNIQITIHIDNKVIETCDRRSNAVGPVKTAITSLIKTGTVWQFSDEERADIKAHLDKVCHDYSKFNTGLIKDILTNFLKLPK